MTTAYDITLLSNGSATGSAMHWPGGEGLFAVHGTFGGATVKLQWSPNGGTTWFDVDRAAETFVTYTAQGSGLFTLPKCLIRVNVTGGTPSALFAYAKAIDG